MCFGQFSPMDPRCPIAEYLRPWECNAIPDKELGLCRLPKDHLKQNIEHFFMDYEKSVESLMNFEDVKKILDWTATGGGRWIKDGK